MSHEDQKPRNVPIDLKNIPDVPPGSYYKNPNIQFLYMMQCERRAKERAQLFMKRLGIGILITIVAIIVACCIDPGLIFPLVIAPISMWIFWGFLSGLGKGGRSSDGGFRGFRAFRYHTGRRSGRRR